MNKVANHDFAKELAVKITDEDYHRHSAISNTGLGYILKSPAHYQAYKAHPKKPTPEMLFGTYFHLKVLLPEVFKQLVVVSPAVNKNTNAYKAWVISNAGKIIVSEDELADLEGMQHAIHAHPRAKILLENAHNELAFFWQDKDSGVQCRCKPDVLREGHMLIDLKTTKSAERADFGRHSFNLGYHRQAAFYLNGVSAVTGQNYNTFCFIAVEKEPPYGVTLHTVDDAQLELGRMDVTEALRRFKASKDANQWHGYDEEIDSLHFPPWAYNKTWSTK